MTHTNRSTQQQHRFFHWLSRSLALLLCLMVGLALISYEVTHKKWHLKSMEQGYVQNLFAHSVNGFFNEVKGSS